MELLMKQRIGSLKQDFDIYNSAGEVMYEVKGKFFSLSRELAIYEIGQSQMRAKIKQKLLSWMPQMDIYVNDTLVTSIRQKLTFFREAYDVSGLNWRIEGDILAYNYQIYDQSGELLASIQRKLLAWSDTFKVHINNELVDPIYVIAVVMAIDLVADSADAAVL